ncbi:hypothetical protein H310_04326 [Aphanomyces invadans]|uniref:Uncharacterized protein n=1 Tax=Aphanomyces invadans TaxID=157072 RepID=A0A024UC02_9STRA|nr:hypothetical protein H310_04326 [Aphanomyces invadans]ETW03906.1 hypothetical protein H310_04326 [Aphanomyces invadans]|eukprot:XP_008866862.1 hypothetical protein H310_04326 [Aphanomyces invadans]
MTTQIIPAHRHRTTISFPRRPVRSRPTTIEEALERKVPPHRLLLQHGMTAQSNLIHTTTSCELMADELVMKHAVLLARSSIVEGAAKAVEHVAPVVLESQAPNLTCVSTWAPGNSCLGIQARRHAERASAHLVDVKHIASVVGVQRGKRSATQRCTDCTLRKRLSSSGSPKQMNGKHNDSRSRPLQSGCKDGPRRRRRRRHVGITHLDVVAGNDDGEVASGQGNQGIHCMFVTEL